MRRSASGDAPRLSSDEAMAALRDLAAQGLDEEQISRALLDLTLQAAGPDLADAVRLCALPAWFYAELLALLQDPTPPSGGEPEGGKTAANLIAQIAEFSFVLPREAEPGGYTYHEATRERLLDWWRKPENRECYAKVAERLARPYLALARKHNAHIRGPDYREALVALDDAWTNLAAAWEGIVEMENWPLVSSFAYVLVHYFPQRGLWTDYIAWTEKGLEACRHLGDEAGTAAMQNNLGEAYRQMPTGDRAANLARAIDCFQEALRFLTAEAVPLAYATTQNNLGVAYRQLSEHGLPGDRSANLARAINCYQEALRFYTPEAAPLDYAMTQNNLGTAYRQLPEHGPPDDWSASLARAIECFREALRFLTPEAAPLAHATIQNNLGTAYRQLSEHGPPGDGSASLARAIEYYEEALRFRPPEVAPRDYAMTQNNLGLVYHNLEDYERAIDCYREALRFRTPEAAPLDYATTQSNLGLAYLHQEEYEEALEAYGRALEVNPEDATAHYNTACAHALRGDAAAALDWLEKAIALDGKYREMARDDKDFDAIRHDERFQALVAAQT